MKVNPAKSKQHLTITLRCDTCSAVFINNISVLQDSRVKYLGLIIDSSRLTWKDYIHQKRKELNARLKLHYRLLHPKSYLQLKQKFNIYGSVIRTNLDIMVLKYLGLQRKGKSASYKFFSLNFSDMQQILRVMLCLQSNTPRQLEYT